MEATKKKFVVYKYSVLRFEEDDLNEKLFECIPDLWFVDENRNRCYFPPKTGKQYMQRAINCERPEDNWGIYECTIVSEGHLTYHAGFKVVKEKCAQRYNTSSADEELEAAKFRREHPGLIGEAIEHIFLKPESTTNAKMVVSDSNGKRTENVSKKTNVSQRSSSEKIGSTDKCGDGENTKVVSKKTNVSQRSSSKKTANIDKCDGKNADSILKKPKRNHKSTSKDTAYVGNCDENNKNTIVSEEKKRNEHVLHSSNSSLEPSTEFSRPAAQAESKTVNGPETISAIRSSSSLSFSTDSCLSNRFSHSGSKHSRTSIHRSTHSRSGSRRSTHSRSGSRRSTHSRSGSRRSTHSCSGTHRSTSSRSGTHRSTHSGSSSHRFSNSRSGSHRSMHSRLSHQGSNRSRSCSKSVKSSRPIRTRSERVRPSHSLSCSNSVQLSRPSRSRSSRSRLNQSTRTNLHRPSYSHQIFSLNRKRTENFVHKTSIVQRSREPIRHLNQRNGKALNLKTTDVHNYRTNPSPSRLSSNSSENKDLIATVKELAKAVQRNNDTLTQNDRRLHRLEVTINKIFITVGDLNGNNRVYDEDEDDQGFNFPNVPIVRKTELFIVHKKLKDKEFRKCWLKQERNFCCPTKTSTDTVTITKYLKRFIEV